MSRRGRGLDARALEETATEGVAESGQGTAEVARRQSGGKNSLTWGRSSRGERAAGKGESGGARDRLGSREAAWLGGWREVQMASGSRCGHAAGLRSHLLRGFPPSPGPSALPGGYLSGSYLDTQAGLLSLKRLADDETGEVVVWDGSDRTRGL